MSNEIINSLNKDFENIKKIDENGVEYWQARELMPLLGYPNWQKAEEVIMRAAKACVNSGQNMENHFNRLVKLVEIGSNTMREIRDWKLDRYACYLITQNGYSIAEILPSAKIAKNHFFINNKLVSILSK